MKKALLLTGLTLLLYCYSIPAFSGTVADSVAESFNRAAFEMFPKLNNTGVNILISPLNIGLCLTSLYSGARTKTEADIAFFMKLRSNRERFNRQLKTLLGSLLDSRKRVQISVNSKLIYRPGPGFSQSYVEEMGNILETENAVLDNKKLPFQLNHWISKTTMNRITELPGSANSSPVTSAFANTFYFYGAWETQFDRESTTTLPFYTDERSFVHVDFMSQSGTYGYIENDEVKAIEIPFKEREASFILILPKARKLSKISYDQYLNLVRKMKWQKMDISVPKFKVVSKISLTGTLKESGLRNLFERPDLSFMTKDAEARPEQFVQATYVELHENGTEGASGAAIKFSRRRNTEQSGHIFTADRPFIFLIRDNRTGLILFLGKVGNPNYNP